jgi:hypothetical protein
MSPLEKLLELLATLRPGPLRMTEDLGNLLANCWENFAGSGEITVTAADLPGRIRAVVWRPPVLSFELSPNQAAVRDSGETSQRVELDVEKQHLMVAKASSSPPPTRAKSNMIELAEQIVRLVLTRRPDNRLRWYSDGSVRVAVGTILPEGTGFKQTVSNRRRRFRLALDEKLTAAGWRKVKDYVYAPPSV